MILKQGDDAGQRAWSALLGIWMHICRFRGWMGYGRGERWQGKVLLRVSDTYEGRMCKGEAYRQREGLRHIGGPGEVNVIWDRSMGATDIDSSQLETSGVWEKGLGVWDGSMDI
jgi:hypothetical protein